MGFIYKITNKINQKVYIGQTNLSLDQRWKAHLHDYEYKLRIGENRPLYQAFKKYGLENFSIEQIEETNNLNEREQFYIQKYRSYVGFNDCWGYNATLGGDSRHSIDWTDKIDELIKLYNLGFACTEIGRKLNISADSVITKLKSLGFNVTPKANNKIICQLDLDGNLIEIYPSAIAAANALNSSSKNLHIGEVCKGKRKTGGGFRWMYYEDYVNTL